MTTATVFNAPEVYEEHRAFWAAAKQGTLLIGYCQACQDAHYYPRTFCPHCHSEDVQLQPSTGLGEVYTYSVMRHGTPYVIAFVKLDDGPIIMTNIVDCDVEQVSIGQRVRVVFKETTDAEIVVPCFTVIRGSK